MAHAGGGRLSRADGGGPFYHPANDYWSLASD